MDNLKGRVALVTGSSTGLGKTIALMLAQKGADVVLCARNLNRLKKTADEIQKRGVKVYFYQVDGKKLPTVKKLFKALGKEVGQLDILVNNLGGVEKFGSFLDLSPKNYFDSFELNFMSMVYFTKAALPYLQKSKSPRIINISTVPARQPGKFNPHYSASKAASLNLSKHLSNLFAVDGILVNSVCPSSLTGQDWRERVQKRAAELKVAIKEAAGIMEKEEKSKVPLNTLGQEEDVANAVAFLASDDAKFITGACIGIDGGTLRSIF
ncbi:SDR family oxidoreductase [Candidatus Daviesbacteria bacterium]|nr:SDR family oxidoreductase [Candidatus Daviesbacteria bacterium]